MRPAVSIELEPDGLEVAVDQVIAECDGDPRAAVRALIVATSQQAAEIATMEGEINKLIADMSRGYSRGRWDWLLERAETPIPHLPGE